MKETSRFYSSLGLLIFLNAVIKPVWIFGIDRMVQNTVGTVEYGTYFSLFNLSIVFIFLLDLGLTAFFNRQLAAQKENFIDHIGTFLLIKIIFIAIYVGLVCSIAWFTHIDRWDIVLSIIFIQAFQSLFVFFRGVITAHQWFRTDAWLSVLDKTLMILLCGSFIYLPSVFGTMTIDRFLFIQLCCTGLATAVVLTILLRKGIPFPIDKFSLPLKNLFIPVLPFALIVLLMSLHYRLDGFLLERIHPNGAHEAGLYAAAYRLLDASNMIGVLIASFLLPYIARQWSEHKSISEVVLTSRHFLILFSIVIACISFFLAGWIEKVLYHNNSADAIAVIQWCIPAIIGYSLVQIYGTIMSATGHIISFCYIVLISVVINVVINLILIPSLGAKSCCYAALASQGFCGITTMIYVRQKEKVPLHYRSVIIYIFTAVLLGVFLFECRTLAISKILIMAGAGLITLIIMFASGLFKLKKWIGSMSNAELK